jgi:putative transposase
MGRLLHRTANGCSYFVTTKAVQNIAVFQVHEIAEIVVAKLLLYRQAGAYMLHEFVLMPNHLHLLLTPTDTTSLEKAMQFIKGGSSHEIHQKRGNRMATWQAGFHEATIRDSADYHSRARYIHLNPVAAGLVARTEDWPWGSAGGKFSLDPIPQRLKPPESQALDVGALEAQGKPKASTP